MWYPQSGRFGPSGDRAAFRPLTALPEGLAIATALPHTRFGGRGARAVRPSSGASRPHLSVSANSGTPLTKAAPAVLGLSNAAFTEHPPSTSLPR
jgi:hypothetical protein